MEEIGRSNKMPQLTRSLEAAEIIRSMGRLALMSMAIDSRHRIDYKEALSKPNNEIRDLIITMMTSLRFK